MRQLSYEKALIIVRVYNIWDNGWMWTSANKVDKNMSSYSVSWPLLENFVLVVNCNYIFFLLKYSVLIHWCVYKYCEYLAAIYFFYWPGYEQYFLNMRCTQYECYTIIHLFSSTYLDVSVYLFIENKCLFLVFFCFSEFLNLCILCIGGLIRTKSHSFCCYLQIPSIFYYNNTPKVVKIMRACN